MGGKKGGENLALILAPFLVFLLGCGDQNSQITLDYPNKLQIQEGKTHRSNGLNEN